MTASLARTARRRLGTSAAAMLSNSGYLVLTTIVTAGLGFGYWWVAARTFSPDAVGVAAAVVSLMSLLGYVGMLGLGTLLIGEIHRRPGHEGPFVATAMSISAVAGGLLGVVATLVATGVSAELAALVSTPAGALVFAFGVALTSSTLVVDQALVGLLRARWQFLRNLVFASGKLVLLVAIGLGAAGAGGAGILVAWVAGLAASILPLAWIALHAGGDLRRFWPDPALLRQLRSGLLAHHALNLSVQAPALAMPVLIALVLSSAAAAFFYTAWMIAGFVSIGTSALAMTLFSVGSRDEAARAHATRLALALSAVVVLVAIAALAILGPFILGLFGARYAVEGEGTLLLLAFAALPGVIKAYFVQACRFERRLTVGAAILATAGVAELAAAAAGSVLDGITGAAAGYAIATLVNALVMAPTVLRSAGLLPRLRARPG